MRKSIVRNTTSNATIIAISFKASLSVGKDSFIIISLRYKIAIGILSPLVFFQLPEPAGATPVNKGNC
jgi:hypothetical protein